MRLSGNWMVVGGGGGGEDEEVLTLPVAVAASMGLHVVERWSGKELMAVSLCGNSNLMGSESKESPLDRLAIYEERNRNQVSKRQWTRQ